MKRIFSRILLKIAFVARSIEKKLSSNPGELAYEKLQYVRAKPWFEANGDKTLRLDYPLNEHSFVVDLGGFEGQWASDIFSKYQCRIFIFEAHVPFAETIKQRFRQNHKIKVFPFGLGSKNETLEFHVAANSSSTFNKTGEKAEIQIVRIKDFFEECNIDCVDLIKINIEGGEYELLEFIIESDLVNKFKNIQVQFHDFFPGAKDRMNKIQVQLNKSHELTYQYEFVWENWRLKSVTSTY